SIQKFLNTFVSVCGTAAYRNCCTLTGSFTQNGFQFVYRRNVIVQITHHQLVIQLADFLNQLCMIQLSFILQIFRDIGDGDIIAFVIIINVSFHLEQVDDSLEFIFLSDRKLQADRVFAQTGLDLIYSIVDVCAKNCHLVYVSHTMYMVGICLTPYIFRLRFYTTLCAENADSAIQYTQGTLNFYGEVNVARGIDDVDAVFQSAWFYLAVFLQSPVAGSSG